VDPELEQVTVFAEAVDGRRRMRDQPGRRHAAFDEDLRDRVDRRVGCPVEVEAEDAVGVAGHLAAAAR
jgi:hypothetical protein